MTYEEAKMQIQAIPGKIWDQLSEPDREAMGMAFSALEKQIPSAQPEVARCKNCVYSTDFYQDGDCYCKRPSKDMEYIEEGWEFYCAAGRRRTDDLQ